MKLSVIIPSRPSAPRRARTRRSLEAASDGLDVEFLVVEDAAQRGAAWARNRALGTATGDYLFFCDDDDTVTADFFRRPLARLEASGADICLFQYASAPLKRDYDLVGNAAVRAALLPAFFGLSLDDVRRWNAGGDLLARREPGSVCRAAFRRDFLVKNNLRFREDLPLYEDAFFLSECALVATRVVSLRENLYVYEANPSGTTATTTRARRLAYKFAVAAARAERFARDPSLVPACAGSLVFSALEILATGGGARRYARRPEVAAALRAFPLSVRHPLVALGVLWLRMS